MTRKTATARVEQPDLLGGDRGLNATTGAVAASAKQQKTATKPKAKPAEVAQPATSKGTLTIIKNNPTNTLAVLTQAMSGKDGHNLQIVAALHKEMIAEQARLDYIEAKRQMKRKLPIINKDGKIEYKDKGDGRGKPKPVLFASYENLHDSCADPMFEFGFDIAHAAQPGVPGMINVVTTLVHTNGHSEQSVLPMPHDASGGKSGAQGWASAFSFGKRVNMIGLLDIVTRAPVDRDTDGARVRRTKAGAPIVVDGTMQEATEQQQSRGDDEQVEVCSEEQLTKVRDAIAGCGVSDKAFCKHFQIEKVSQLPAARYQDALVACKNHSEQNK